MDNYRTVMEVLKYLPPQVVLLSSISVLWHRACISAELWVHFLEQYSFPFHPQSDLSPRDQYRKCSQAVFTRYLVRPTQCCGFNCRTGRWRQTVFLSETIKCDLSSGIACLSSCEVFVCGGGAEVSRAWSTAYLIHEAGTVTGLERMETERLFPGVIAVAEVAYVFGGKTQYGREKSAARIPVCQGGWEALGDMSTARSVFNPCSDGLKVYLCGGGTPDIELFDLNSLSFSQISQQLPSCESVTTVLMNGLIVIITSLEILTWKPGEKVVTQLSKLKCGHVWGNSAGCSVGNWVYLPWGQLMQRIHLNTGQKEVFWAGKAI